LGYVWGIDYLCNMGTNGIEQLTQYDMVLGQIITQYDMVLVHRSLNGFTNESIHKRPSSNEED
jgi:hypothetical protein